MVVPVDVITVFRRDGLEEVGIGRLEPGRVAFEDAVDLLRPEQLIGPQVEFPVAERGDLLRFPEPGLTGAEGLLGAFQRADVGGGADVADDPTLRVVLRLRLAEHPGTVGILVDQPVFRLKGLSFGAGLPPQCDDSGLIVRMQRVHPAVPLRGLRAQPRDLAPPLVHIQEMSLRIGMEHPDRRDLGQAAVELATAPQRLLRLAAFRDVVSDGVNLAVVGLGHQQQVQW
jgi:hypothetical protein